MELRHLRYFVAVAEELNFSRAARKIRIAQPALSQQIRAFEGEIGVDLFVRSSHEVRLTHAGMMLLPKAREVLEKAHEAELIARRASRGEIGTLTLGFITAANGVLLDRIIRYFREQHPEVELRLFDMPASHQEVALREGRIDVGILRAPVDSQLLSTEMFGVDRLVLSVPEKHPLGCHPSVGWKDLVNEPFVTLSPELNPRFMEIFAEECRREGLLPKVVQRANDMTTLLRLVAAGIGVAPATESLAKVGASGVRFVPLSPPGALLETVIAWRKDSLSPVVPHFLAAVSVARRLPEDASNVSKRMSVVGVERLRPGIPKSSTRK